MSFNFKFQISNFRLSLFFFVFSLLSFPVLSQGQTSPKTPKSDITAEEFLSYARRPPANEAWAEMEGEATHRRSGADVATATVYLGIRFTPERTLAQVLVNNEESYIVGQAYSGGAEGTSVITENPDEEKKSVLADFGLRPEDLALSFMFWEMEKELPSDTVRGSACRVFLLKSPKLNEYVKVYINKEYYFPLKAECYRAEASVKNLYRTVEVTSFKKEKDFWILDGLMIYGPGWKTKLDFSKTSAGFNKDGIPADIFRKIKR